MTASDLFSFKFEFAKRFLRYIPLMPFKKINLVSQVSQKQKV